MDAFDADDKAATRRLPMSLNSSLTRQKFVKKFSSNEKEKASYPAMESAQQQMPAAPQQIVVHVNASGGGNGNETKVPATWLVGEW